MAHAASSKRLWALVLAVTTFIAPLNASTGLFEVGQEYQFSYIAWTDTGVRDPVPFTSGFGYRANLVVQRTSATSAVAKFSDIVVGIYNGPEAEVGNTNFVKKPTITAPLEKPIRITYKNGKVTGLDVDPTDPLWSVNIKKGLATALQVDVSTGGDFGKNDNTFFRTIENTITGNCETTYSFGVPDKNSISIVKQRTVSDCTNVPRIFINSFGGTTCSGEPKDPVVATTQAYYRFDKNIKGGLKPQLISSMGYNVIQWHAPEGTPFYNLANQTMFLKTSGPIGKALEFPANPKHYDSLAFSFRREVPGPQEDVDLTADESYFHPEELGSQEALRVNMIEAIRGVAAQLADSVDQKTLESPAFYVALSTIQALNLQSLKATWMVVQGDPVKKAIFVDLLPLSGTNPAAVMIKELVSEGKVSDWEARKSLSYLPYYLRVPTEKLLVEYESLLKPNPNIKSKQLNAAVLLSFGHLIGVTCNAGKGCKNDVVNKYSKIFLDRFKASKDHAEQTVLLQTIANTKLPALVEKLIPFAKSASRALRPQVLQSLQVLATTKRDKFLAVVMPIMMNPAEPTEIRIAAFAAILNNKASFLELQQITAGMIWERNAEVLNFILSSFKAAANSKSPCLEPLSNQLQLLLRRVAHLKTSPFRSSNRWFDYKDPQYGMGGGLQLLTVYNEESRVPLILVGRAFYRIADYNYLPLEIYLRLEGVEDAYVKAFKRLDPNDFKMEDLKNLLNSIKVSPRNQAPLKIEFAVRSQGYTMMYRHVGAEDLKELREGKGLGELIAKGLQLSRNLVTMGGQYMQWRPNDLGFAVGIGLATPSFGKLDVSYGPNPGAQGISRAAKLDADIRLQVATFVGTHNPLGAMQGISKVRMSSLHLPLSLALTYNPATHEAQLKWDTPTQAKPLSLFMSSKTAAFVLGKDPTRVLEIMKETCASCKPAALVTSGKLGGEVFRDKSNERLGLESQIEVMDCERYTGKGATAKLLYNSFKPSDINSRGSPVAFLVMGMMHLRNYLYVYPRTESCAFKAVLQNAKENPASAVELRIKPAPTAAKKGSSIISLTGQFLIKGEPNRQWNIDGSYEAEPFNIKSKLSIKIARQAVPSLDLKPRALCLTMNTAWSAIPDDIFETPSTPEPNLNRDATLVWGEAPANECPPVGGKGVASLVINTVGNITNAQREAATKRDRWPFTQCDADRRGNGRTGVVWPLTDACFEAADEYTTPRSYVTHVSYSHLSDRAMRSLRRLDLAVKAGLVAYWESHAPHDNHGHSHGSGKKGPNSGHIELRTEFAPDNTVDLHVHTDELHSHYEDVDILKGLAGYLRNARLPMAQELLVKAGLIGICDVAPKVIVSLDNVTIPYNVPNCYTLASADCSAEPRYAVLVKKSKQGLPLAAKIYIGGHSIELVPTAKDIDIKINDKAVTITTGKPYTYPEKDAIVPIVTIIKLGARYFIMAPELRLSLRYTGDDLTMFVPASHRASHCGLCGDFNGQSGKELIGPTGCALATGTDLANAYVLKDKACKESIPKTQCLPSDGATPPKDKGGIVSFLDMLRN